MKINNYYDSFHYIFFGIYFVVCLALIAITLFLKVSTTYVIVGIIELIVITILMIFFYVKAYFLQKDKLVIRAGFIRKEIPYKSIKKCYVVKNINPFYFGCLVISISSKGESKIREELSKTKVTFAKLTGFRNSLPEKIISLLLFFCNFLPWQCLQT